MADFTPEWLIRAKQWVGLAKPVAWQEVIELDPKMPPDARTAMVSALDAIAKNLAGQSLLTNLKDAQEALPKAAHWPLETHRAENPAQQNYDQLKQAIMDRRQDQHKLLVYASPRQYEDQNRLDRSIGGSHYLYNDHVLVVNLHFLSQVQVPKTKHDGSKAFLPDTLEEALAHEMQHAVDHLNKQFSPTSPLANFPFNEACIEDRAVRREATIIQALHPEAPFRHAYADNALYLDVMKKAHPELLGHATEANMQGIYDRLGNNLVYDAQCDRQKWAQVQEPEDREAAAVRLTRDAGISMPPVNNKPGNAR